MTTSMTTTTNMSMTTSMTTLKAPLSWHEQCEWENAVEYEQGYRAGYAAAEQDVAAEICAALGRPAADAKAVIRWLVRTTGTTTAERGAAA